MQIALETQQAIRENPEFFDVGTQMLAYEPVIDKLAYRPDNETWGFEN